MGCCCSSETNPSEADEEERERLLSTNGVARGNARRGTSAVNTNAGPGNKTVKSSVEGRDNDEQSVLNDILAHTMSNIIDVSAIDAHGIEHHEYVDRVKKYTHAIVQVPSQNLPRKRVNTLLSDAPHVEKLLGNPPTSHENVQLVQQFAQAVLKSLSDIKVQHQEDLVVQFGVQQSTSAS